jgi:ribosomal protein S18 acetylase RimI-like enzyme
MKIIALSSGLLLVIALGVFGAYKSMQGRIYDFVPSRDTAAILQNFNDDWYWLIAEGLAFDTKWMLETRSPDNDPAYHGKLIIKVILDQGKTAAFTTYYRKSPQTGRIQFISVNRRFRGKGYAKKMVDYAVKDLFKQGCQEVILSTRVNNIWARRVYENYGFVAYKDDGRFVEYVFKKP